MGISKVLAVIAIVIGVAHGRNLKKATSTADLTAEIFNSMGLDIPGLDAADFAAKDGQTVTQTFPDGQGGSRTVSVTNNGGHVSVQTSTQFSSLDGLPRNLDLRPSPLDFSSSYPNPDTLQGFQTAPTPQKTGGIFAGSDLIQGLVQQGNSKAAVVTTVEGKGGKTATTPKASSPGSSTKSTKKNNKKAKKSAKKAKKASNKKPKSVTPVKVKAKAAENWESVPTGASVEESAVASTVSGPLAQYIDSLTQNGGVTTRVVTGASVDPAGTILEAPQPRVPSRPKVTRNGGFTGGSAVPTGPKYAPKKPTSGFTGGRPRQATPPRQSGGGDYACSETEASSESVERCINAIRMNPSKYAKDFPCSVPAYTPRQPLSVSPQLTSAAYVHAQDMARYNAVTHTGSDGSSMGTRIWDRAGFVGSPIAENVAGGQQSAKEVVFAWMCSEGHRKNIMSCDHDAMGTGLTENGSIYWAQTFGCTKYNECTC